MELAGCAPPPAPERLEVKRRMRRAVHTVSPSFVCTRCCKSAVFGTSNPQFRPLLCAPSVVYEPGSDFRPRAGGGHPGHCGRRSVGRPVTRLAILEHVDGAPVDGTWRAAPRLGRAGRDRSVALLRRVEQLARAQHGVATITQVLDLGTTKSWIRWRVSVGLLLVAEPGVLRLADSPDSWELRAMSACLAAVRVQCCRSARPPDLGTRRGLSQTSTDGGDDLVHRRPSNDRGRHYSPFTSPPPTGPDQARAVTGDDGESHDRRPCNSVEGGRDRAAGG